MFGNTTRARRRVVATIPVLALAAAGLATMGATTASAAPSHVASPVIGDDEYYMNYVAPRAESAFGTDDEAVVDVHGKKTGSLDASAAIELAKSVDTKYAKGNPQAARGLAKFEDKSIKTGKSPKNLKGAKSTQEAKLLTILVEFDENAADDFSDLQVPTEFGATTCKPGDVQSGPLHNNIPNPADYELEDNNSMWVPDFSSEHFNRMLFTDEGITERVRTDLTGPDGQPGFDISGYTMKAMYEEMSRGAYTVTGSATPWITVPHSEAYYGATVCHLNADGVYEAGPMQDMQGHPDNPLGPGQLPIDAVAALADAQPDFPWADYDIEDQGDRDGDGNVLEPDGVIDHVVLVHAGEDKSGGGGEQGTYALWAHSSAVAGGAAIPGTDLMLSNYIVQPEDSGVGVFAHEYGHDLGLPDLYDTSNVASSDVDFWDLMSSGSHSGPIFQSMPTHMGIWDKWVLGWVDPVVVEAGSDVQTLKVGQTSRPKKGTQDGVKVNLPDKTITLAEPHSGEEMWYTGADQDWADLRLGRTIEVPADAKFWMWNNFVIEADWDYGFVEVSTDGGTTWSEQKVFAEGGTEVSTPDGYSDPNGRMADFGGGVDKKYGLTGDSHGWRHDYVDLTSYAGQTVKLRLRLATDAAFQERGWFADDFALTSGATTVWSDDVENGDAGWTPEVASFTTTTGPGWRHDTGTSVKAQYYLVEWRNFDGFDEGLKYGYNSVYQDGAWKVEKLAYNAPGALVWYRDTTYGNSNQITANETALPSYGAKGGLLIVDSHFNPLQRTGDAAAADPSTLNVMPSRAQSSNAAFGLTSTYPFTECFTGAELTTEYCTDVPALPAVSTFTDDQGWVPGFALRESDGALFYRDRDASVVVPSVGNSLYTTPLYDLEGNRLPAYDGLDVGLGPFGSGNPADSGVGYGTVISVKKAFKGNEAALIEITPPAAG
ncbi:immune inhibitor A domain-containing protein [Agromyces ramosus]|uniref:Immune inhibitor A n=1 Tax=Agromyces ramosus TaxID=33879 RepID=A0ABU0R8Y6_9MICO|nr:immune inhibitor A domain-containing protein [Agromyces ramosus]MDQ0894202.1 immune inhibitor A [Agromyces ramosus]